MAMTKDEYQATIFFPVGEENPYGKFFVGQSYLASVSEEQVPIHNVTFEPGCRNNWHIHDGVNLLRVRLPAPFRRPTLPRT